MLIFPQISIQTMLLLLCSSVDEVKDKWYACSYCHSRHVPNQELVGGVFNNGQLKPVAEWDMSQPEPLAALRNRYESPQIALCGLYSTTVKHVASVILR